MTAAKWIVGAPLLLLLAPMMAAAALLGAAGSLVGWGIDAALRKFKVGQ